MDPNSLNKRSKGHGINGMNTSFYKPPKGRPRTERHNVVSPFYREEAARVKQLREAQAIARNFK